MIDAVASTFAEWVRALTGADAVELAIAGPDAVWLRAALRPQTAAWPFDPLRCDQVSADDGWTSSVRGSPPEHWEACGRAVPDVRLRGALTLRFRADAPALDESVRRTVLGLLTSFLTAAGDAGGESAEPVRAPSSLSPEASSAVRNVFDASPDSLALLQQGRVVAANPRLLELFGVTHATELSAPTLRELVGSRGGGARPPAAVQEVRWVRPDGSAVWLECRTYAVELNGAPAEFYSLRNVTERKAMEARLTQAERMASLGTLAAGIAHEINNPLAYVVSNLSFIAEMVDLLHHERLNASQREAVFEDLRSAVREAQQGGLRMRDVVRDLKTFTRPADESRGPVEPVTVLEDALRMAERETSHRARIVREYQPTPSVDANASRLSQVFLNLVVNAAQAFPDRDASENVIRIRTRTDERGDAVVEVEDNGTGMTDEVRRRIFDPFFTTKQVGVGTGLGLSICLAIVTTYGGKLDVDTAPGRGTTFRVTLPAWRAGETDAQDASAPPTRAERRRLQILIVDDEPLVCSALRRMLEPEHRVVAVNAGRAALERILSGERFDLLLCDLMMPAMTGMALHERLAELAPDQCARMLFMTGGTVTDVARRFVEGGRITLEKPFTRSELEAAIRDAGILPRETRDSAQ